MPDPTAEGIDAYGSRNIPPKNPWTSTRCRPNIDPDPDNPNPAKRTAGRQPGPRRAAGFTDLTRRTDALLQLLPRISNHRIKDAAIHAPIGAAKITLLHLTTLLNADRADHDPMRYMVHPTNADIALATRRRIRTVEEHLAELENDGWIRRIYRPDTGWRLAIDLTPLVIRTHNIEHDLRHGRRELQIHRRQGNLPLHLNKVRDQISPNLFEGLHPTPPMTGRVPETPVTPHGNMPAETADQDHPPRKSAGGGAEIRTHISSQKQRKTDRRTRDDGDAPPPPALADTIRLLQDHEITRNSWTRTCMVKGLPEYRQPRAAQQPEKPTKEGPGHEAATSRTASNRLPWIPTGETLRHLEIILAELVRIHCTGAGRATSLTWAIAVRNHGLATAARMLSVAILDPGRRKSRDRYLGGLVSAGRQCRATLERMLVTGEKRIRGQQEHTAIPTLAATPLFDIAGEPPGAAPLRTILHQVVGAETYSRYLSDASITTFDERLAITVRDIRTAHMLAETHGEAISEAARQADMHPPIITALRET